MSQYIISCKLCHKAITKSYKNFFNCAEDYAELSVFKELIKHIKLEHPTEYTKEVKVSANKAIRKMYVKIILWLMFDIFIRIPLIIIVTPLFLLYLGLDKIFDIFGEPW